MNQMLEEQRERDEEEANSSDGPSRRELQRRRIQGCGRHENETVDDLNTKSKHSEEEGDRDFDSPSLRRRRFNIDNEKC